MSLTLVGDLDQMMYRFAGARPEVVAEEVDRFITIGTMKLSTNYRSTKAIIEASKKLIARNYEEAGGPYPQELMKDTQARPDAPEGEPISFQMYPTPEAEADGIVETILEQLEEGYNFEDFFVGSRTRAQLGYLEGKLFRAGVKFINITGGSFWDSKHVKNILGFIRLALDESDDEAFQAVFNIASSGHTDRSGKYCHHHWMGQEFLKFTGGSYKGMDYAISKNRRYYYGVTDLRNTVNEVRAQMAYAEKLSEVVDWIWNNVYKDWLKASGEFDEDADGGFLDDIETVKDVMDSYQTMKEFISAVKEMIQAAKDAADNDWSQYVVLSTYHRLKGQERKVVIGMGWCEGHCLITGRPRGLLPHTFSMDEPPQFDILPTGSMARMEDERCIAFVAITRAEEKVFLTGTQTYRTAMMGPSRFIQELGIEVEYPEALDETLTEEPKFDDELWEEAFAD